MYYYKTIFDDRYRVALVKEEILWTGRTPDEYRTPEELMDFCRTRLHLDCLTEERVYCFCLDSALHLTGYFLVSAGTINQSLVSSREVFLKSFLAGAVSLVLIHNHPSGNVSPSGYDCLVTEQIAKAGMLIGIELLDHLILGKEKYYSFKEMEPERLEVKL